MSYQFSGLKKKAKARLLPTANKPVTSGANEPRESGSGSIGSAESPPRPEPQTQVEAGSGEANPPHGKSEGIFDRLVHLIAPNGPVINAGKSTASATAKLLLCTVRDSADAFPPLKSVAGGLCSILENLEVWLIFHKYHPHGAHGHHKRAQGNKQTVEWLAPRVKLLAELLCAPVSEDDAQEDSRRKELKR